MNTRQKLVLLPVLGIVSIGLYSLGQLTLGNRNTYICQSNLKQIGLGLSQYQRDYDEKNVLARNWRTALWPYTKKEEIFDCPSPQLNYALNRHTAGISLYRNVDYLTTPVVFDSVSMVPGAADFGSSLSIARAHPLWKRGSGANVLFYDGHVKWMQQKPIFQVVEPRPARILIPSPRVKPATSR